MAGFRVLEHKYEYRRRMPHYQKAGRPLCVTFCKLIRSPFPGRHAISFLRTASTTTEIASIYRPQSSCLTTYIYC
jgi:hypothetical protein